MLVHGAWHGAWCWHAVAERLRAAGRRVLAPDLTGLGRKSHLLSAAITLDTCIADVTDLIEAEDLSGVVLVGHSFGGAVVLGVADRVAARLHGLVFLDSLILESGRSPFDMLAPAVAAERRRLVREAGGGIALPVPPVSAFGIPEDHPAAEGVRRRLVPHPAGTYESALTLVHPLGNGLPCTYVHCTQPSYPPLEGSRALARARPDWRWRTLATGHDAMVTAPDALARLLLDAADAP